MHNINPQNGIFYPAKENKQRDAGSTAQHSSAHPAGPLSAKPEPKMLMKVVVSTTCCSGTSANSNASETATREEGPSRRIHSAV